MNATNIRGYVQRVRWRWVLPVVMVGTTAMLLVLAGYELSERNSSDRYDLVYGMNPPAVIIARAINGPGYSPSTSLGDVPFHRFQVLEPSRLLPVLVFWSIVGLALEKRLQHQFLAKRRWHRFAISLIGLSGSVCILWTSFNDVRFFYQFYGKLEYFLLEVRQIGLWAHGLNALLVLLWATGFTAYFSWKLLTLRGTPRGTNA